jgi:hypothetical protein
MLFVEQTGKRFVVKSFREPNDTDEQSEQRVARELAASEAFETLGVRALRPVFGPERECKMSLDERKISLEYVLVFPFRDCRTLQDAIAETQEPLSLIRGAGTRVARRHGMATSLLHVHSDGAPHNIFEDWTWFDFAAEHGTTDLAVAKANEVWRFISGLTGVTSSAQTRTRVAAFCEAYADLSILTLARDRKRRRGALLRMLAKPHHLWALSAGDTRRLRRLRAWRALNSFVKT